MESGCASWDSVPSGRLGMSIADATSWNWSRDRYLGHWRDRKTTYLERYLDDAMTAMVAGAVAIRLEVWRATVRY